MIVVDVSGTVVEIALNIKRVSLSTDHIFLHTDLSLWTLLLEASVLSSILYASAWFHSRESVLC